MKTLPRALVAVLVPLLLLLLATPSSAYPGAPWFQPGTTYTQNFPDPSVVRVGGTYYAYGTATGGAYLPAMSSTDLQHWTARPAYDPGAPLDRDPYFNDALPRPARWALSRPVSGRLDKEVWAPGVAKIAGRYVAFYSVRLTASRFCISVASSASPLGPFVDGSTRPLVCDSDPAGSVDPSPYVDPASGRPFLVWKSEGVPGRTPTRIWSQEPAVSGFHLKAGARGASLLRTQQAWEGRIVESPSMVAYRGALWLFWSGNDWASSRYAIGYARCASPLGPCTRMGGGPLLKSSGTRLGPGGESAFVDASGQLRLAHHYWNAPYTSYPAYPSCQVTSSCTTKGQRRLAVELLGLSAKGGLAVR